MNTTPAHQPKSAPTPNHFLPCDILLEQAQICCYQAREAARLSRLQAASRLLCTARDLLHQAATARLDTPATTPLKHHVEASSCCSPAPCTRPEATSGQCLSLCLREAKEQDPFLQALESRTGTPWRWAGDILAVEKVTPHRVVVLRGDALESWRDWRGAASGCQCELSVQLFAPMS